MPSRLLTTTLAALAAGLLGCSPPPRPATPTVTAIHHATEPAPTGQPAAPAEVAATLPEGAVLTVVEVLDAASRGTPTRAVFSANREAAAAAVAQAGAWANPEIEVGVGRARAREADEAGMRTATTTAGVRLSQRFELPGKRSSRIAAAQSAHAVAERGAAVDALDLELEVRAAAMTVALADLQTAQAAQAEALATQVRSAVLARHTAGEGDRGDLARADAELATARLALDGATRDAQAARAALGTWCGGALPTAFTIGDALPASPAPIPLAEAQRSARDSHPRLALLVAQRSAAAASVAREERAWYPDLTVGVSGAREADTNDVGLSVGMEIPLWNRNDGGVALARADEARVIAEQRVALAALERQVLAAWSTYERERNQVEAMTRDLLPAAHDALRLKLAAFTAGDAALFELIDAKRGLLAAEQALLDAQGRSSAARLDLARAIGAYPPTTAPATSTTNNIPSGATP